MNSSNTITRQREQTLSSTREGGGGGGSAITKPSQRFVVAFHQGNEEQHDDLKKFQGNTIKGVRSKTRGGSAILNPQRALLLL